MRVVLVALVVAGFAFPFAIMVTTTLADVGSGDDRPWEYASIGTPVYPYYVSLPDEALERVQVGDEFLWYAAG